MSWPCCPVCKWPPQSGHMPECPWQGLLSRVERLDDRVNRTESEVKRLQACLAQLLAEHGQVT